jgi:hypothetical protein
MNELCRLVWCGLIGFFRSRASLEAEILVLRHQLNVLRRKSAKRPSFGSMDRLIFAGLYRLAPNVLSALAIVRPETVIRWHRAGFCLYWRWKSRSLGGRPKRRGDQINTTSRQFLPRPQVFPLIIHLFSTGNFTGSEATKARSTEGHANVNRCRHGIQLALRPRSRAKIGAYNIGARIASSVRVRA